MSRTPPQTNKTAAAFLNKSDNQGAHNRSQHVGQTGNQLKGRNIQTATTYLGKADQNMGAKSFLNSPTGKNLKADVAKGPLGTKIADTAPQKGGRLSPIAKVAVKLPGGGSDVFNAKVTSNKMVMVKNSQGVKAQSTFPDGGTRLEKPAAGPNLKPASVLSVQGSKGVKNPLKDAGAMGRAGAKLNKVGAPAPKPLTLDGQKQFKNMTKNVKK